MASCPEAPGILKAVIIYNVTVFLIQRSNCSKTLKKLRLPFTNDAFIYPLFQAKNSVDQCQIFGSDLSQSINDLTLLLNNIPETGRVLDSEYIFVLGQVNPVKFDTCNILQDEFRSIARKFSIINRLTGYWEEQYHHLI